MRKFVRPSEKIRKIAEKEKVPIETVEKRIERIMRVAGLSQANATSFLLSVLPKQKGAQY